MTLSIELPAEIEADLRAFLGPDPNRTTLESLVADGYRQRQFGIGQVCRMLGFESRSEAESWLGQRGISWNYGLDDLEADRSTLDALFPKPA